MSATARGAERAPRDAYYTPRPVVEALLPHLRLGPGHLILEPAVGDGAIADVMQRTGANVVGLDISEGADYLTWTPQKRPDLIITNPPFSQAQAFAEKALRESDCVIILERLDFLGAACRLAFWQANPPTHLFALVPRPSFNGAGTDSCNYGWFCWDRGGMLLDDQGIHHLHWKRN